MQNAEYVWIFIGIAAYVSGTLFKSRTALSTVPGCAAALTLSLMSAPFFSQTVALILFFVVFAFSAKGQKKQKRFKIRN